MLNVEKIDQTLLWFKKHGDKANVIYQRCSFKDHVHHLLVDFLLGQCPPTYIDPAKYGNPEKAVRQFAKEIDQREIKWQEMIGEGELKEKG